MALNTTVSGSLERGGNEKKKKGTFKKKIRLTLQTESSFQCEAFYLDV